MRLIDADELKKEFCKDIMGGLNWERIIDNAPAIKSIFSLGDIAEAYKKGLESGLNQWELQRPHGEWLEDVHDCYPRCSVCGHINGEEDNFCPDCGADMREV